MPAPVRMRCLISAMLLCTVYTSPAQTPLDPAYARDSKQPVDSEYTAHIQQYTTMPELNTPLTDYLPASKTVPTPMKVLGDVSGAPGILPYAEDVYRYFRMLEKSSPRVKVFTIGRTEEGREMIAVAVADEALLRNMAENDARLAKLADPRTIGMNDETAEGLIRQSAPVYYITGTIHSPETGAPTALMELAYRLAVDESAYIRYIRSHTITLITPVVEVDGRDRMVDLYKWHLAHPEENYPRLIYWGHYVAHDNNRDAMTLTLQLTRNVLDTYLGHHAQVLHDLHESVPFLYDNTVGDEPYNAWIDPILTNEWQMLGWSNISEMTRLGLPGVFTHGEFDTWSPGYLMFLAAMHNGISRLYETFGNGGADTVERILRPGDYGRTWYRQNPPYPKVLWSQRDNNNYEQNGLLTALYYFSQNDKTFLRNYYLKSKRSIEKPGQNGPAAYVIPPTGSADRRARLLEIFRLQHVEVSRTTAPVSVTLPAPKTRQKDSKADAGSNDAKQPASTMREFPAGSYIVRMDQPYSRIADALLDRQYWAPDDPQKHPYDDTGWSLGDLFNVEAVRVTDVSILKTAMTPVDLTLPEQSKPAQGSYYLVANDASPSLFTLRFALKNATVAVTEAATENSGQTFPAGSLLVSGISGVDFARTASPLHLRIASLTAAPSVATHAVPLPRIAMMHTWISTQTEGWWRQALDSLGVPYDYISTQTVAATPDLRSRYDVLLFAPVGGAHTRQIVDGMPMWGNPLPWRHTDLTPNIGRIDSTTDMRPGLGNAGVEHLREFVAAGGLLITAQDTAEFAIDLGLAPGVTANPPRGVQVTGSVLGAVVNEPESPVAYGYNKTLAVYSDDGLSFGVSNVAAGGDGAHRFGSVLEDHRPTGRGGAGDQDSPQGRRNIEPDETPKVKPWQAAPLNEEQLRNNPYVIPAELRPQVILRFEDTDHLLVSGLLNNGQKLAEHATVVTAHYGKGAVLLFANNPVYRGETIGSYALLLNAVINFDHLDTHPSPAK